MSISNIVYITGNPGKLKYFKIFSNLEPNHLDLDLHEIQSLDIKEVVEHKVKDAYRIVKKPVLVEDTSLVFNALGKLPGPLIKWFLDELGNDGLCQLLDGYSDRSAEAVVLYGLYDGQKIRFFEGRGKGTISKKPKGDNSFGWDKIFIPTGHSRTHAQMNDKELSLVSLRKIALLKLEKYLEKS